MSHYLLLVALTKENAPSIQKLRDNVLKKIDDEAKVLWTQQALLGLVMKTDRHAVDIWDQAIKNIDNLRDVLVLELGRDWIALRDTTMAGWLNSHFGPPLPWTRRS